MTFRTEFDAEPAHFTINPNHNILLLGSCFTEGIGRRLQEYKFQAHFNPFGIVYNPVSIANSLEMMYNENYDSFIGELFENQGLWNSWSFHSSFSAPARAQARDAMETACRKAAARLRNCDVLLITFGISHVFQLLQNDQIVANNHKMPAHLFSQSRLSVETMVEKMKIAIEMVQILRPNLQILLTISPVRHLRLGMVENQRSKAALLLACAELCQTLPNVTYFPAYEIIQDDLRDYRFYASDLLHPNDQAVEYVWSKFGQSFFTQSTLQRNAAIEKLRSAMQHRPFHPNTPEHRKFAQQQIQYILKLNKTYPELDLSVENDYFSSFLHGTPPEMPHSLSS